LIVLGICDSHEGHACVVKDGVLLGAIAEERLSRLKSDMGYPRRAIDSVLATAGISPEEIDLVAMAGEKSNPLQRLYKLNASFSVADWIEQNRKYWGPRLLEGKPLTEWDDYELFKHKAGDGLTDDPYYSFVERAKEIGPDKYSDLFNDIRAETIFNHLGIARDKIVGYRHEDCHKIYGYYSAPFARERALVFTVEGMGDDSSATVSTIDGGKIEEHWRSNDVQLGRLYRYVTLLLGMKPNQHEFKVMGLAPYGTEYNGRRSLEFFRRINSVVGTEIHDNKVVKDLYYSVRDALEGERFDGLAWGLQTWLEEMLDEWIGNNCRAHGIDNVIFSGGVAQNIKACKLLTENADIRQFWAGPISGDGSLGIGAAWLATRDFTPELEIEGLPNVYLGSESDAATIDAAIQRRRLKNGFQIIENPTSDDAAGWLERGLVLSRFSGRMEFGQRALGNRSILADPRDAKIVERINQKIKMRDFWMPFTPSMLADDADEMLVNPKKLYSPFMTMAFDLKPGVADKIPAAIHPADKTARPQMLRREANPAYYDLISAFKKRTGLGVVMNTSFNLHGEAIVESPDDAIDTLERSDLDVLLFDHVAVSRVDI